MREPVTPGNILVVDDDATIRRALSERVRHWGHRVREVDGGEAAIELSRRELFDLVFLDLSMPGRRGLDVLREWAEAEYDPDVIVLTAHGSYEAAVEALRLGASDFLQKPADFTIVESAVNRLLAKRRASRVQAALWEQIRQDERAFTSSSPGMNDILDQARRAGRGRATVLLLGESGTGKGVLAEFIHRESARPDGPFIYVSCLSAPEHMIDDVLFGHERGAFTGAVARKEGRLEAAAGGTAFLDEIGDIPPAVQVKLLRFLDSGEFERLGGNRTIRVDCRVVAATNRDLGAAMKAGSFREDLYHRLNVIRLVLPPLRERVADIPPLAALFLDQLGGGPRRLAPETLDAMQRYAWPGNIRELRNAIERMLCLTRTDVLTPDLLPPETLGHGSLGTAAPSRDPTGTAALPENLDGAVRAFKTRHVTRVLEQAGWNQTAAAKLLGLQRPNLNRLMKQLGIRSMGV